jgi:PIN domain nuclease of toxin-antitoxin system
VGSAGVILLDTQVLLWWLHHPNHLSKSAGRAIARAEHEDAIVVSAISVWEIAVKNQIGKLTLPMEINVWFEHASAYPGVTIEPMDPRDAIASTRLPGEFHKDPADRIIVAMARRYGAPIITSDAKILNYPHVRTIW